MIILLGQHQFTVSSIVDSSPRLAISSEAFANDGKCSTDISSDETIRTGSADSVDYRMMASMIMNSAEELFNRCKSSIDSGGVNADEIQDLEQRFDCFDLHTHYLYAQE